MEDALTLEGPALGATAANGHVPMRTDAATVRIEPEALELARERGMERELHELVAKAVEIFPSGAKFVVRVDFAPWLDVAPVVLIEAHQRAPHGGPMENHALEWIGWKRAHCPFEVAETFMILRIAVEGPPEG